MYKYIYIYPMTGPSLHLFVEGGKAAEPLAAVQQGSNDSSGDDDGQKATARHVFGWSKHDMFMYLYLFVYLYYVCIHIYIYI